MRPVFRGKSPQTEEFTPYTNAQQYLVSRLGHYCSYCERRVATNLAVEHLQPKGDNRYIHLIGSWENFLLACVNCNSTKGEKDVVFKDLFMPDRDNTFAAFSYPPDGSVVPSELCNTPQLIKQAQSTLALTGLDKPVSYATDENGIQVYLDRVGQRQEVWLMALEARKDLIENPTVDAVKRGIINTAKGYGFFSIWMSVFSSDTEMRNRLIDAFSGTRGSGCFDSTTTEIVSPSPNLGTLHEGGKI
ncbi:HNH endonuclease [Pseudomonas pudica]|uniref:HNH endonuclease n=1 Tax=Pseudomonas pudica TaxID=272772 RepID=A0ABS0FZB2_9PSED|nr:HNH endonuclease [Pseudomonas pudica]MBF8645691.1 HNH endonuclease [Pseudomonas pudica]MBF8760401.1 HNH endonuclease [Pseudomonas pudica]